VCVANIIQCTHRQNVTNGESLLEIGMKSAFCPHLDKSQTDMEMERSGMEREYAIHMIREQ
jgi:hypothetical protein